MLVLPIRSLSPADVVAPAGEVFSWLVLVVALCSFARLGRRSAPGAGVVFSRARQKSDGKSGS
eukprot:scaffold20356_cov125-Isochrysis_galbana.AAC.16